MREILGLRVPGLSATAMARTQPVSKTSVFGTFHAADEKGVAQEDVEGVTDAEAYALLFPERVHDGPVYAHDRRVSLMPPAFFEVSLDEISTMPNAGDDWTKLSGDLLSHSRHAGCCSVI